MALYNNKNPANQTQSIATLVALQRKDVLPLPAPLSKLAQNDAFDDKSAKELAEFLKSDSFDNSALNLGFSIFTGAGLASVLNALSEKQNGSLKSLDFSNVILLDGETETETVNALIRLLRSENSRIESLSLPCFITVSNSVIVSCFEALYKHPKCVIDSIVTGFTITETDEKRKLMRSGAIQLRSCGHTQKITVPFETFAHSLEQAIHNEFPKEIFNLAVLFAKTFLGIVPEKKRDEYENDPIYLGLVDHICHILFQNYQRSDDPFKHVYGFSSHDVYSAYNGIFYSLPLELKESIATANKQYGPSFFNGPPLITLNELNKLIVVHLPAPNAYVLYLDLGSMTGDQKEQNWAGFLASRNCDRLANLYLDYAGGSVTDEFFNALLHNPNHSLTTLAIINGQISGESRRALAEYLKSENCPLHTLELKGCSFIDASEIAYILEAIWENPKCPLSSLEFSNSGTENSMSKEVAKDLAEFMVQARLQGREITVKVPPISQELFSECLKGAERELCHTSICGKP